jgi:hypothetical protein
MHPPRCTLGAQNTAPSEHKTQTSAKRASIPGSRHRGFSTRQPHAPHAVQVLIHAFPARCASAQLLRTATSAKPQQPRTCAGRAVRQRRHIAGCTLRMRFGCALRLRRTLVQGPMREATRCAAERQRLSTTCRAAVARACEPPPRSMPWRARRRPRPEQRPTAGPAHAALDCREQIQVVGAGIRARWMRPW